MLGALGAVVIAILIALPNVILFFQDKNKYWPNFMVGIGTIGLGLLAAGWIVYMSLKTGI